jgi:autotransporter-associated beta strand protein
LDNWNPNLTNVSEITGANLVMATRSGTGSMPTSFLTGGDYTIRSLTFDNSAGRFGSLHNLQNSTSSTGAASRTLTFGTSGVDMLTTSNFASESTIRLRPFGVTSTSANATFNVVLGYTGQSAINTGANTTVHFDGSAISGTGGIQKTGTGTLRLSSSNSFSGGLSITSGTVVVDTVAALGSTASSNFDAVVINGGTLQVGGATARSAGNRGFRVGANVGVIDVVNGVEFRVQGGVRDVSGQAGVLRKIGTGVLSLENLTSNLFTGETQLQAGTLRLNNNALSAGSMSVSSGATLDGYGTVSGDATFASGSNLRIAQYDRASTDVPAPLLSSVGSLTFNSNLTLGDLNLFFDLDTVEASDRVQLGASGVLNIGSGVLDLDNFTFTALTGFGPGTYTLFSTSQSIAGSLGSNLVGTLGGYDISLGFGNSGTSLDLIVAPIPEPSAFAALAGLAAFGLCATRRRRRA